MKTVLITGIGGDIGQGIASIIREVHPDWRLIGMDIHERHGGSLFVDRLYNAPSVSESSYLKWINEVIQHEDIDICIPMSEAELLFFAKRNQDEIYNAMLLMANSSVIEIGADKLATAHFLESIGIKGPWTMAAEKYNSENFFPCIFKPRRSSGSKCVFTCHTSEDIIYLRKRYPDAVIQELLLPADKEVTCAIYRSREGKIAVLELLRTLIGGFTGWAMVIDNPVIKDQCVHLAEALKLRGSINVQLRLTDQGPYIFEINPRFSSTILIRHRMGFRDVIWSLHDLMNEPFEFYNPQTGTTAVRLQGASIINYSSR